MADTTPPSRRPIAAPNQRLRSQVQHDLGPANCERLAHACKIAYVALQVRDASRHARIVKQI
jgi:hypothetical protein